MAELDIHNDFHPYYFTVVIHSEPFIVRSTVKWILNKVKENIMSNYERFSKFLVFSIKAKITDNIYSNIYLIHNSPSWLKTAHQISTSHRKINNEWIKRTFTIIWSYFSLTKCCRFSFRVFFFWENQCSIFPLIIHLKSLRCPFSVTFRPRKRVRNDGENDQELNEVGIWNSYLMIANLLQPFFLLTMGSFHLKGKTDGVDLENGLI